MKKSIFSWATIALLVAGIFLTGCEEEILTDNYDYAVSGLKGNITSCHNNIGIKLGEGRRTQNKVIFEFTIKNNFNPSYYGTNIIYADLYNTSESYAVDNKGNRYTYRTDSNTPHKMNITVDGSSPNQSGIIRTPLDYHSNGAKVKIEFTDVPEDVESFSNISLRIESPQSTVTIFARNYITMLNIR